MQKPKPPPPPKGPNPSRLHYLLLLPLTLTALSLLQFSNLSLSFNPRILLNPISAISTEHLVYSTIKRQNSCEVSLRDLGYARVCGAEDGMDDTDNGGLEGCVEWCKGVGKDGREVKGLEASMKEEGYRQLHPGYKLRGDECYNYLNTQFPQVAPSNTTAESNRIENPVYFHAYWRSDLQPFRRKQMAVVRSFLATQLEDPRAVFVLWVNNPGPSNKKVQPGVESAIQKRDSAAKVRNTLPGQAARTLERQSPSTDHDQAALDILNSPDLQQLKDRYPTRLRVRFFNVTSHIQHTPLSDIPSNTNNASTPFTLPTDPLAYSDGDITRLLLLYHHGGIWIDMDTLLLRPFRPLLTQEWIHEWDCDLPLYLPFNGALMHFHQKSATLAALLSQIAANLQTPSSTARKNSLDFGALLYWNVYKRLRTTSFKILPWCYVDPFICRGLLNSQFRNAFDAGWESWKYREGRGSSERFADMGFAVHWHNQWDVEVGRGSLFEVLERRHLDVLESRK
ncbi:hypothetical protein HDV05_006882 [Chytridiales sp. JEL 0842]|nr:hypothetical protein HDV05_006882 [Chytridiales sp. JEL 0842]